MSFDFGALMSAIAAPTAQAIATIRILEKQNDLYEGISKKRIKEMDEAVTHFVKAINRQIHNPNNDKRRFRDAFGEKPKVAKFVPVDTGAAGKNAAEDSLRAVPAAKRAIEASNRIMEQESLVRAMVLDGRYVCVEDVTSCTISDMINGHLPVSDVVEIVKDVAEQAAMLGRIGNTHDLTARHLGISRLRCKISGINIHFQHLQSLNQNVHRVGDRVAISDFLQTPAQRLGFALTQAQLIQQSLQNEYNMDAAGHPTDMGILQARMQQAIMVLGTEAQRGNMINQFVPNYAALLAPAIDSITQGLIKPVSSEYSATRSSPSEYTAAAPGSAPASQQAAAAYSSKSQVFGGPAE